MIRPWIRNTLVFVLCAAVMILAAWWPNGGALKAASVAPELTGTVAAPAFPEGLEWINTDRPLTTEALRGRIVLLEFWTYC